MAFDVLYVLVVFGIDGVVVMKVVLRVGEELLSVTVVNRVVVGVREGRVALVGVIVGIGDLVVWILAVVGIVIFVVPVVEEISVWRVVSVVGLEEEVGAMVVVVFPGVAVIEVVVVELPLSLVVLG